MTNSADSIKSIRHSLCLSKAEFARALEIDKSCISNYELGKRKPAFEVIRKIIKLAKASDIVLELDDIRTD